MYEKMPTRKGLSFRGAIFKENGCMLYGTQIFFFFFYDQNSASCVEKNESNPI